MSGYSYDSELIALAPPAALMQPDLTDVTALRTAVRAQMTTMEHFDPPDSVQIKDVVIPGGENHEGVGIRTYTATNKDGACPALIFARGGGFVVGGCGSSMEDRLLTEIADAIGGFVVSVDYRLAPEHPFPAGLEDCYSCLMWVASAPEELGIDPHRIGVYGISAGGALAAGLTLLTRDRGGPALCFQLLEAPALDDRLETHSMRSYRDALGWTPACAAQSWRYYLSGSIEIDGRDGVHYAVPARAVDLSELPPAYVSTCEFDPLRDEAMAYAHRLMTAGVSTEFHNYPGTFHTSMMIKRAAVTRRMSAERIVALQRGLRSVAG